MSKNKNQAPFSRRPAHAVASRRSFIRGTMGVTGTGLVLGSGLWTPTLANSVGTNVRDPRFRAPALSGKPGPGEPTPIPSVFFFPGPPDSSDPAVGHDPSVINNFNGFVGVAENSAKIEVTTTTPPGDGKNGFSFVSDPLATSASGFAEVCHDHNGVFFPG